ncbi:MAG TPA: FKBP-type peptidyl-prolyl cis-trans isomerase [Candidatus Angelobacter sp.]|nr:FKBP-type peptidyl-prolyl cis-trans isomerase [Candidatus Angelobacter sp.]
MATPRSQRIGILIIALVMIAGTLGSFLVMGLSINNQKIDQTQLEKASNNYQLEVASQTMELSGKYYGDFIEYMTVPSSFNADDIKELTTKDLKVGDGEEIKADTQYNAYYIGWNPEGVIFDQSIAEGTLKAPIASGSMIAGWNEGVIGMKVGGVRELTIPSDKAYGAIGSGENIPADTPIKFIVMIIPKVTEIPIPDIILQYYANNQ